MKFHDSEINFWGQGSDLRFLSTANGGDLLERLLGGWQWNSWRGKVFGSLCVMELRALGRPLFTKAIVSRDRAEQIWRALNEAVRDVQTFAAFVGTESYRQKLIIFYEEGNDIWVRKAPLGQGANSAIKVERAALSQLNSHVVPLTNAMGDMKYYQGGNGRNLADALVIKALEMLMVERGPFCFEWVQVEVSKVLPLADFKNLGADEREIQLCCEHGDFAYWNLITDGSDLVKVIDWEYFAAPCPIGYDFFRFKFSLSHERNFELAFAQTKNYLKLMVPPDEVDLHLFYVFLRYAVHEIENERSVKTAALRAAYKYCLCND